MFLIVLSVSPIDLSLISLSGLGGMISVRLWTTWYWYPGLRVSDLRAINTTTKYLLGIRRFDKKTCVFLVRDGRRGNKWAERCQAGGAYRVLMREFWPAFLESFFQKKNVVFQKVNLFFYFFRKNIVFSLFSTKMYFFSFLPKIICF